MLWNFSSLNTLKVQNEDKNLHTWSGWEMVTFFSSWEFFARSCENQLSFFSGSGWICLSLVRCLQLVGMFCHSPSPSHSLIAPLSFDIQHNVYRACSSMFCIQFERKLKLEFDQPASNSHPGSALSGIFSFPRISRSVPVAKIGERPGKNQTRNRVSWVKRVKWFVK